MQPIACALAMNRRRIRNDAKRHAREEYNEWLKFKEFQAMRVTRDVN
jgi:hypothetical protein